MQNKNYFMPGRACVYTGAVDWLPGWNPVNKRLFLPLLLPLRSSRQASPSAGGQGTGGGASSWRMEEGRSLPGAPLGLRGLVLSSALLSSWNVSKVAQKARRETSVYRVGERLDTGSRGRASQRRPSWFPQTPLSPWENLLVKS